MLEESPKKHIESKMDEVPVPRNLQISPVAKESKNVDEIKRAYSNYKQHYLKNRHRPEGAKVKKGAENNAQRSPYMDLYLKLKERKKTEAVRGKSNGAANNYGKAPKVLLSEKRREKMLRDYSSQGGEVRKAGRELSLPRDRAYIYMKPEWWG